ncbi:MAG: hypothetical protein OHK0023_12820 [Anaerolineae bacterium]
MTFHATRSGWLVTISGVLVVALWMLGTPNYPNGKAQAIGYAICHQITLRSIPIVGDMVMPLCARCTGIYLGATLGFLVLLARGRLRAWRLPRLPILLLLLSAFALLGIDGLNSYLTLFPTYTPIYPPNNVLRLVTGMLTGVSLMHLLMPFFNRAIWSPERVDDRRSVDGLVDLAAILALAAVTVLFVLSERPLIVWTLGILSSLGVLLVLMLVGAGFFVAVTRRSGTAHHWRDLALPLLAGAALAFVELSAITIIRYALTGTWAGFNFG